MLAKMASVQLKRITTSVGKLVAKKSECSNKIYKLCFCTNKNICSARMSARIRIKLSNDDITVPMLSIALIRHS